MAVWLHFKIPFEIIGALVLLVILGPVMMCVSALIFLIDGRPVFFCQERIGKNQVPFRIIKFRTMFDGAHLLHPALIRSAHESDKSFLVKRKSDPRATHTGIFLRRFYLDELPQLFNVLRGEMSFVGPRPMLLDELPFLNAEDMVRFTVLPGMTGLAQIRGGGALPPRIYLKLDRELARNENSCRLYFQTLLRTPLAILQGKG